MAYIGKGFKDIATANIAVNTMVGDGSDTTLGLSMGSKGVGSVNDVSVFVGGIQQRPGTDFTLSGSTITFTTAPADGVKVVAMSHGDSWNNAPSDNTVTAAKLKDASVTSDKIIGLDAGKLSGSLSGSGVNLTNLNAANISGTLPAIDGSALTGVSAYENETSDPTATENKTLGTMWVNKTSGEMYILTDDTTNANVWTNVGDGSGTQPYVGMVATGGSITTDGDYKVHSFTTSGTFNFTVTAGSAPEVEYLVIAGGGSGGSGATNSSYGSGGGGAGGYRTATGFSVSAQQYTVVVGAGGANPGADADTTNSGSDSSFSSITSAGGGGGGARSRYAPFNEVPNTEDGKNGGSGGGSAPGQSVRAIAGLGNTPSTTPSQGNDGGQGGFDAGGGAGGGGAGTAGSSTTTSTGAAGGDGLDSDILITGSNVTRAGGGGGGGNNTPGSGGSGGGGTGSTGGTNNATAGDVNSGSGGGGSGRGYTGGGTPAAGGSGIVILRYKFQ